MNIVVVLPYANADWFDICSEVTLTTGPLTAYRISCSETVDEKRVVLPNIYS